MGAFCIRCKARVPLVVLINNRFPATNSAVQSKGELPNSKPATLAPPRSPALSRFSRGHCSLTVIS